jgi:hypothetical protein
VSERDEAVRDLRALKRDAGGDDWARIAAIEQQRDDAIAAQHAAERELAASGTGSGAAERLAADLAQIARERDEARRALNRAERERDEARRAARTAAASPAASTQPTRTGPLGTWLPRAIALALLFAGLLILLLLIHGA